MGHLDFLNNIFLVQVNEKYGRLDKDPMTEKGDLEISKI
jgi:hypothetical protein